VLLGVRLIREDRTGLICLGWTEHSGLGELRVVVDVDRREFERDMVYDGTIGK
jgi:hypothetical protein